MSITTTTPGGTYTRLTSMPITTSTYTHYSLVYGQTYYYAISSISTSWRESAYSSSVAAIPESTAITKLITLLTSTTSAICPISGWIQTAMKRRISITITIV
jgi:hypothetical protein